MFKDQRARISMEYDKVINYGAFDDNVFSL